MQISRTRLKNSNIHSRVRHCEWFFFFFFFFFDISSERWRNVKRPAISVDSPRLIPRVSKFTSRLPVSSHWGIIAELSGRSPRKTHPISTHFRHFYAQRGGTLKWKHRVVAYGCRYSEITVSVYTPWFPRFSSDATVTHLPHSQSSCPFTVLNS